MVVVDDDETVIDIHLRKLVDWIVSRRMCPKQWRTHTPKIREMIATALLDMPEHDEMKKLLMGSKINYFTCTRIIEILKETEKESKTFFGSYGSKRMVDWQAIVKLYKSSEVHIAEASQMLIQSCLYDVQALKKQLNKCLQIQDDCDKMEVENVKKRERFISEFHSKCSTLGIRFDDYHHASSKQNVASKVLMLLEKLPDIYSSLFEDCRKLHPLVEMYSKFRAKTCKINTSGATNNEVTFKCLETLSFFISNTHWDVTVYEWRYGEKPLTIETNFDPSSLLRTENEEERLTATEDVSAESNDEIDWGDFAADDNTTANHQASSEEGTIDWSVGSSAEEGVGITLESSGTSGGVAKGEDALTLLDNRSSRVLILDDLNELSAFLKSRILELENSQNVMLSPEQQQVISMIPVICPDESLPQLMSGLDICNAIIQKLTQDAQLTYLQSIRSSSSSQGVSDAIDKIYDSLRSKLNLIGKAEIEREECERRSMSAGKEHKQINEEIKLSMIKNRELKKDLEKELSGKLKNVEINIMGVVA